MSALTSGFRCQRILSRTRAEMAEWTCINCGSWRDEDEPECPWCGDSGLEPRSIHDAEGSAAPVQLGLVASRPLTDRPLQRLRGRPMRPGEVVA